MKRLAVLLLVLVTLPLGSLLAADGAIPIWGPTTITESGSYVVTRDITSTSFESPAITISADNVDLDLNGFAIAGRGFPVEALFAEGSGISIHDGTIISDDTDYTAIELSGVADFAIRRLIIQARSFPPLSASGGTVSLPRNAVPRGCGTGLSVSGNHGVVEDNMVSTGCVASIAVSGMNMNIRGNTVRDSTLAGINANCTGCRMVDNRVSGTGPGLVVAGDLNHVEGNVLIGDAFSSDFGLLISGNDNVYRGNTVRGNGGTGCSNPAGNADFCDVGAGNTSHGDNYMPGQM